MCQMFFHCSEYIYIYILYISLSFPSWPTEIKIRERGFMADAEDSASKSDENEEGGADANVEDNSLSLAQVYVVRVGGIKQHWLPEVQSVQNMTFARLSKYDPILCKLVLNKSMNRHLRREVNNLNTTFWPTVCSLRRMDDV